MSAPRLIVDRPPARRSGPLRRALHGSALASTLLVLGGWSFFDPFHAWIEKGNRDARQRKADEALGNYDAAAKEAPSSPIPDFNRGIVLAREGKADEAKQAFESAQSSSDAGIAADAHYNNGNMLLDQKDTKGAIEQYLRSLDLDPTDPDARRNLEIAMRKLEEEQKQQQQQQQDQDQKKDDEKDDSQQKKPQDDSEKKDDKQPPGSEQKKPDEPKPNEQPDAPDSSSSPGQEPPPQPESQQPMEGRLSREDAARLLNAIQSDELKVLRKLEEKKGQPVEVGNDW